LKGTEVTTHLVAPLKTLRPLNQQEIAMARRQPETHLWSFDPIDDTSVPNARIALALMVCVRRLPGAFPEHDFDDLGAVLGPVLEVHDRLTRATILAHIRARKAVGEDASFPETKATSMLRERSVQTLCAPTAAIATIRTCLSGSTRAPVSRGLASAILPSVRQRSTHRNHPTSNASHRRRRQIVRADRCDVGRTSGYCGVIASPPSATMTWPVT
jgi:hypothetical protein